MEWQVVTECRCTAWSSLLVSSTCRACKTVMLILVGNIPVWLMIKACECTSFQPWAKSLACMSSCCVSFVWILSCLQVPT